MKRFKLIRAGLKGAFLFALMLLPQLTDAQAFNYNQKGDVLLCFRRPTNPSYEMVVDFSNVLSFVSLPVGSVTNINVYSKNNLTDAFGSGYTNVQWSVLSTFVGSTAWSNYAAATLWFTVPRSDPGTQTTPPPRQSSGFNSPIRQDIIGIGINANAISSALGSTNSDNYFQLVLEPVGPNDPSQNYASDTYSVQVEDPTDGTVADFKKQLSFSVENVTPAPFSSAVVSDFYQSVIGGAKDPTTGVTNGNSTYLGYFTLNTDGTMTFTRQSSTTTTPLPPPPPVLSITRSGNTSTISFGTTNGATYTLLFTNVTGLKSPISTWSSNATSITGNGATNSFMDSTTDPNRIYGVSAH